MSTAQSYIPGVAELGRKNQAGGYVGIDGSGDVIGTFAQRIDTAANIAGIVLKNGELAFTTDTQETFIGDGVTAGGKFLWQKWQAINKINQSCESVSTSSEGAAGLAILTLTNAVYEVVASVDFSGDSTNSSSFALAIIYDGLGLQVTAFSASASWLGLVVGDGFRTIEEETMLSSMVESAYYQIAPQVATTRAGLGLVVSMRVKGAGNSQLFLAPNALNGVATIKANVSYLWRRIL
ncbi:MAG: hypothetical protein IT422_05110 [Pirellulaceae bacterium]|nr:hypothetical protein [Pirellulaceae bacterium]